MKKRWKTIVMTLAAAVICQTMVYGYLPYQNYTYSKSGDSFAEPQAYLPSQVIGGETLGIGKFENPSDIFITDEDIIYVADTDNSRIVVLNKDLSLKTVINRFSNNGQDDSFQKPEGIYVTNDKIYVADTGNKRIVVLDPEGKLIRIYNEPRIDVEAEKLQYTPIKIVVDRAERMFVVSRNVNRGIIELDKDGNFTGYFGTLKTQTDFITALWKRFMTQEQIDSGTLTVPTEYSSCDIDDDGFIFTTVSTIDSSKTSTNAYIQKINSSGVDILRRQGLHDPIGDLETTDDSGNTVHSQLVDVCVGKDGRYSVLDQRRGRVFTYDYDGNLLYIFGGSGNNLGQLQLPRALAQTSTGQFLVSDGILDRIVVFYPTEYSAMINQAAEYQYNREYENAEKQWEKVLLFSTNFDVAYVGVGKALLRSGKYKEAMEYFKLGGDQALYSKAFKGYRQELFDGVFYYIAIGIVVLIGLVVAIKIIRRLKEMRSEGKKGE